MRLNDLLNKELGRYRIESLIGRGGMAAVYRAFDTRLHRHVALKVLYPQYLADDDIVERFRREAVTAAQLDHPHIAPIFDVGEADGLIYLAMKLLPGPSLAELLQREQRLAPQRTVKLAYEIASALDEAHQRGIIHRDIKPGNVLFDDRERAILTDFGIAKSLDAPALTETSVIVGTPDYIAPEQIDLRLAADGKLDHRADLYSLGAMLYRTLTGRRPFDGSSQMVLLAHLRDEPPPASTILPELPASVDAVLRRAMAKQPTERYASALELAHALAGSLGEHTEVGAIFPPAALRREAHTHPTTQVGLHPAASGPRQQTTLPPQIDTPRPVPRRRLRRSILIGLGAAVLVLSALLAPGADAVWSRFAAAPSPSLVALVDTPTATTTTAPTLTASATITATTVPSATLEPSATTTATTAPPSATATTPAVAVVPRQSQPASGGQAPLPRPAPTSAPAPRPAPPTTPPTPKPAPPTTPPTAPPTATDAGPQCTVALAGGFGHLWRTNANVRDALGCATQEERAVYAVEQIFQGGLMYYRDDTKQFWVLSDASASWRLHTDVYESDPEPTETAPAGLFTPVRGFGRLWQKYPSIRRVLGWGATPEIGFTGVVQRFERGTLLYAPAVNEHDARMYVLYAKGTYSTFNDTYTGP